MPIRVELLPGFKFTGKMVKKMKFTGNIGKTVKNGKKENSDPNVDTLFLVLIIIY
jgi:hypothetical protein